MIDLSMYKLSMDDVTASSHGVQGITASSHGVQYTTLDVYTGAPSTTEVPSEPSRLVTIIITVIGIILNSVACAILTRPCGKRKTTPLLLMTMLIWVDLIALLTYTLRGALTNTLKSISEELHCNVFGFINFFMPIMSGFVATLMSIERYLALAKPFRYRSLCTVRRIVMGFAMMTTWAFIIAALPFIGVGSYHKTDYIEGTSYCKLFWLPGETALETLQFCLYFSAAVAIVVIVIFCNVRVVGILLKMRRRIASVFSREHFSRREEMQFVWSMMILTTLFAFCWIPWIVTIGALRFGRHAGVDLSYQAIRALLTNHLVDPLVFFITHYLIRGRLRQILCCDKADATPTASLCTANKNKINEPISNITDNTAIDATFNV